MHTRDGEEKPLVGKQRDHDPVVSYASGERAIFRHIGMESRRRAAEFLELGCPMLETFPMRVLLEDSPVYVGGFQVTIIFDIAENRGKRGGAVFGTAPQYHDEIVIGYTTYAEVACNFASHFLRFLKSNPGYAGNLRERNPKSLECAAKFVEKQRELEAEREATDAQALVDDAEKE